jgi:hypothetical protein
MHCPELDRLTGLRVFGRRPEEGAPSHRNRDSSPRLTARPLSGLPDSPVRGVPRLMREASVARGRINHKTHEQ